MIQIRTLENTDFRTIHAAFNHAFSDYPEPFNKTISELQHLIERRGYRADISFGAFEEDKLVSFTMNGIGDWNGELTVYDTNTATIPEYRRQGLAARIFEHAQPVLKAKKVKNYLLEVLKINSTAIDLYKKQGFKETREFDYYICKEPKIKSRKNVNTEYQLRPITQMDWHLMQKLWDFYPSWQNSIDSISRKAEHFYGLGYYHDERLIAYGFIEIQSGDIPQLAVAKAYRRQGLATKLLEELTHRNEGNSVRFINSDASDPGFKKLMESFGLQGGHGQYEMILKLG